MSRSIARRVAGPVDSAIDLGIALESLLLNDLDDERGELTFRLRVRGARLLGKTLDERREIYKALNAVYGLRSSAVHSGVLSETLNSKQLNDILERGQQIAADLVESVLRRGKSPDWGDVVLGP